ncbi:similar to amino acid permease [Plenodomus lingam JN3]|uniref:Similar to amino acid permease n=1 Tax=Leptosphaeria maculans (strain JN3 / isolate v23.1.3 / race Av1-4-5-6-7-8) TaxID=985895 RepID=E5AAU8_LEPMJ|nr:similar to amino acid permease [Plenodomus lingam JN3]CBY00789.1 similar to amino acid permease [Plenodomus lingam JN3]
MAFFREAKTINAIKEYDASSNDADRIQGSPLGGTLHDAQDMNRMGKKQELRRNFRLISIIGFVVVLQSTWETYFGLFNGGTAGVIWMMVITWLFVLAMIASLAEMASMAPTAGGQYHWVSEFAPPSFQKPLSYIVGWSAAVGWVSGIPACAQMLSSLLIGMVLLAYPDAQIGELWHVTLIMFLWLLLMVGFNLFLAQHLPLAEGIVLVLHVFAFFAFLILFWNMAERSPANQVFTTWTNGGGWSSMGVSALVGLGTPLWCFIGPDAGAHMSEELKDASRVLPLAMMWAVFFNGVFGIIMMITFVFCGGALQSVLDSATGVPVLQAVYNATGSVAGTEVMGALLVLLIFFAAVSVTAASSRQIWAFARDKGLPFSSWIEHVPVGWDIPVNALLVCLGSSLVLACINFGSEVTLNAIVSISNAALIFSYIISIGCVRLKRLRGEPLLPRRWSLGKFGGIINDLALAFLIVAFVFSFFPMTPNPAAVDMNWAALMFAALAVIATANYFVSARNSYIAPDLVKLAIANMVLEPLFPPLFFRGQFESTGCHIARKAIVPEILTSC